MAAEQQEQVEEKILTAAEIQAADDLKPVKVPCPEWGGMVLVRPLSNWEQEEWEEEVALAKEDGRFMPQQYRARLCLKCLVTPSGAPLFGADKLKMLSQKSAGPLTRILKKILEITGMSEGALERAEKNSVADPSASSGSNSSTASASRTSTNSSAP